MQLFFEYELKVAVALAVFTLFYKLLLQKETFHRFNRAVLLATSALAFILPFCVIVRHETVTLVDSGASSEAAASVAADVAAETAAVGISVMQFLEFALVAAFFAGSALMMFRIFYSILKIRKLIAGGRHIPQDDGTTLVIVNNKDFSPISWMKYIVMSEEDYSSANEGILIHERAHIALGHSWDILFFDLMTVLQWFNPAVWLLKADLRALHEYEADEAVINAGTDMREYQLLLVRKAVATVRYPVANSLNHSTLKNRIFMMSSKKTSFNGALKALYVIPLIAVSLVVNAETKYDYVTSNPDETVEFALLKQPTFQGGEFKEFLKWVNMRVMYPAEAKNAKAEGRVYVGFVVEEDGSVADVKVLNSVHPAIDAEVIKVISSSPKWTPAYAPDDPEKPDHGIAYAIPVVFDLRGYNDDNRNFYTIEGEGLIEGKYILKDEIYIVAYLN